MESVKIQTIVSKDGSFRPLTITNDLSSLLTGATSPESSNGQRPKPIPIPEPVPDPVLVLPPVSEIPAYVPVEPSTKTVRTGRQLVVRQFWTQRRIIWTSVAALTVLGALSGLGLLVYIYWASIVAFLKLLAAAVAVILIIGGFLAATNGSAHCPGAFHK